jgi:hypothetical protein
MGKRRRRKRRARSVRICEGDSQDRAPPYQVRFNSSLLTLKSEESVERHEPRRELVALGSVAIHAMAEMVARNRDHGSPGLCAGISTIEHQAQVPRRSFGIFAEGGALPRRMELPGPTSGAGASDSITKLENAHGTEFWGASISVASVGWPSHRPSRVGLKTGWLRLSLSPARPPA